MDYQYVIYGKRDRTAYITINRPEVLNAIHPPLAAELGQIWEDYMADPELWVAILTGAGERAFSAGADLKYRASQGEKIRDVSSAEQHQDPQMATLWDGEWCWQFAATSSSPPSMPSSGCLSPGGGIGLTICCSDACHTIWLWG